MLGRDVKVQPVFVRLFRLLMLIFHFCHWLFQMCDKAVNDSKGSKQNSHH